MADFAWYSAMFNAIFYTYFGYDIWNENYAY